MGGCNVVAILRMGGMVCLELLVLQARPFLRSADRFQYMRHTEGRSLMFGFTISLQSIYDDSPPRADTESDLNCGTERVWLVRLVLNAETVECMSWVCMVCWSKLCCEISLLLNMADMDCLYVEGCGVSSAEYS